MGQVLHASARTTAAVRRAIQHRQESLRSLARRHGMARLPDTEGDKPRRATFKRYPIGFVHIDIAEVRTEQGRLYLLVAIDRTSKFAFLALQEKVTRRVASNFLRALIAAVPDRVHTVLTDTARTSPSPVAMPGRLARSRRCSLARSSSGLMRSNSPAPRRMWSTG